MIASPHYSFARAVAWGAGLLLLGACANTSSEKALLASTHFNANILDNGTKLFEFALRPPRPEGRGGEQETSPDEGGFTRGGGEQGMAHAHANMAPLAKRALEATLQQNHYCREGYLVVEQYEARREYIIRGECRDAADADDRASFPH